MHSFSYFEGQNEKKVSKLQQQNATLSDTAQRRISGQQQQGQVKDFDVKRKKSHSFLIGRRNSRIIKTSSSFARRQTSKDENRRTASR